MSYSNRRYFAIRVIAMIGFLALMADGVFSSTQRPRQTRRQPSSLNWTIPQDTIISMRLDRSLSSRTSRVGDRFTATVTVPVQLNGQVVIPAGSIVEGRVIEVTPARRMSRSGTIAIDFDELVLPDGSRFPIEGNLTSDDPETRETIDDESRVSGRNERRPGVFVGAGGAIGAVLGGIAGGGKGAVLGGIVGAGAGVAGILLSKGEEAQVPAGAPFGIQLVQPLVLRDTTVAQSDPPSYDDPPRDRDREPERVPVPERRSEPERRPAPDHTSSPIPDEPTREEPSDVEPEPAVEPLPLSSPEMIRRAQAALRDNGYYEGQIDGQMSPRISKALKTYQRENKLAETGELDTETARSLGIMGTSSNPNQTVARRTSSGGTSRAGGAGNDPILATVLSASANRTADGSIYVLINTQSPTGGWRWYGDSVVNGDTLEVYARAIRPTGMATQAVTRGRIELNVRDGVRYVRRVVVNGAGGAINVPLGAGTRAQSGGTAPPSTAATSAQSLQRQAEDLLAEYQRIIGVRLTGTVVELEPSSQAREPEIELLFALNSFTNAAQLYTRLTGSLQDPGSLRGATLSMAKEARRADRVITTTSTRTVSQINRRWDAIRQDILKLMSVYNISSTELDY